MRLDEIELPPLPTPFTAAKIAGEDWDLFTAVQMNAEGLRAMRIGALAALDEAMKHVEDERVDGRLGTDDYAYNAAINHSLDAIRRLRDTIAKGE